MVASGCGWEEGGHTQGDIGIHHPIHAAPSCCDASSDDPTWCATTRPHPPLAHRDPLPARPFAAAGINPILHLGFCRPHLWDMPLDSARWTTLEMRWVGARLVRWTRVPSACPQVPLSSPASLAPPDQVRSSSAWLLASPRAPRQHSFAPAGDRSRRDAAVGITTLVRHHGIPRLALEQPALGRDAVR